MAAAVVSGVYGNTAEAQKKMGGGIETEYHTILENVEKYKALTSNIKSLGS